MKQNEEGEKFLKYLRGPSNYKDFVTAGKLKIEKTELTPEELAKYFPDGLPNIEASAIALISFAYVIGKTPDKLEKADLGKYPKIFEYVLDFWLELQFRFTHGEDCYGIPKERWEGLFEKDMNLWFKSWASSVYAYCKRYKEAKLNDLMDEVVKGFEEISGKRVTGKKERKKKEEGQFDVILNEGGKEQVFGVGTASGGIYLKLKNPGNYED